MHFILLSFDNIIIKYYIIMMQIINNELCGRKNNSAHVSPVNQTTSQIKKWTKKWKKKREIQKQNYV